MKAIKAICRRCGLKLEIMGKSVKVIETTEEERIANYGTIDTTVPLAECPECAEVYAAESQERIETGKDLLCACGGHKVSSEPICRACAGIVEARRLNEMTERMHFDQECPKCRQRWSQFPGRVCPDCEAKAVPTVSAMKDFSVPVYGADCEIVD